MRGIVSLLLVVVSMTGAMNVSARDTRNHFPINDAMETPDAKEKLGQDVKFYFGKSSHPPVAKNFGEFMSNKKTNAFNKSDKIACEWAFLSALLTFQQRAKNLGGDAVINIRSYYKKNDFSSETEYECGAGTFVAGVTFKGEVVKLK
jgi:hypothetical protein